MLVEKLVQCTAGVSQTRLKTPGNKSQTFLVPCTSSIAWGQACPWNSSQSYRSVLMEKLVQCTAGVNQTRLKTSGNKSQTFLVPCTSNIAWGQALHAKYRWRWKNERSDSLGSVSVITPNHTWFHVWPAYILEEALNISLEELNIIQVQKYILLV